jgi:hypothetical protein
LQINDKNRKREQENSRSQGGFSLWSAVFTQYAVEVPAEFKTQEGVRGEMLCLYS